MKSHTNINWQMKCTLNIALIFLYTSSKRGVPKRIYLEHFGVDEHGLVPAWFAKDKNITYEEANQKYNDGITWKKTAHEKFGTQLLVTSSADFHYSDIKDKLKKY